MGSRSAHSSSDSGSGSGSWPANGRAKTVIHVNDDGSGEVTHWPSSLLPPKAKAKAASKPEETGYGAGGVGEDGEDNVESLDVGVVVGVGVGMDNVGVSSVGGVGGVGGVVSVGGSEAASQSKHPEREGVSTSLEADSKRCSASNALVSQEATTSGEWRDGRKYTVTTSTAPTDSQRLPTSFLKSPNDSHISPTAPSSPSLHSSHTSHTAPPPCPCRHYRCRGPLQIYVRHCRTLNQ